MDTTIGNAPVYCEVCGEQEISTDHAGLCGACFAEAARRTLKRDGLGDFCCRLLTHEAGEWRLHALCLEPYGSEHDHGGLPAGLASDRAPGKDVERTRFDEGADGYICPVCGHENPTSRSRCPCCGHTTDDHGHWTSGDETPRVPETLVHDLRMFGARSADVGPFQLLDELWAILRRHEMVPSS